MSVLEPYIGAAKAAVVIGVLLGAVWIGHHCGAQGVQVQWDAEKLKQAEVDR